MDLVSPEGWQEINDKDVNPMEVLQYLTSVLFHMPTIHKNRKITILDLTMQKKLGGRAPPDPLQELTENVPESY